LDVLFVSMAVILSADCVCVTVHQHIITCSPIIEVRLWRDMSDNIDELASRLSLS